MQTIQPDHTNATPAGRSMSMATAAVVPLFLFLAAGWFRAGIEKVIDPSWWTGAHLRDFLDEQRGEMLPFFVPFADLVVTPFAAFVSWLVVQAQLAIAIGIITRRHVKAALWAGIILNVTFTMAGRVNPSAFYLVMQLCLLFALSRPVSSTIGRRRAMLWLVPAGLALPFARTMHPAEVIDDPALMLSFVSALAAITSLLTSMSWLDIVDTVRATAFGRRLDAVVARRGSAPDQVRSSGNG